MTSCSCQRVPTATTAPPCGGRVEAREQGLVDEPAGPVHLHRALGLLLGHRVVQGQHVRPAAQDVRA